MSNQKAFTVLELIVVSSITVLLLTLVVTNFRGFENKSVLNTEVEKLVSVLRQAQIWSLTGQTVSGERYYYGVHLEECSSGNCNYILFRDSEQTGNRLYNVGEEMESGVFTILKGAYVNTLSPKSGNDLDIVFKAPLGDIYFNDTQPESPNEAAQIILKHTIYNGQKIITVNRISGQIDVQ